MRWGRWEGLCGCLYIKLVQSTMLGGLLQYSSLVVVRELDLLIAAFSHQLHFFSLAEATLLRVVTLHDSNILALHYHHEDNVVSTIDANGSLLTFKLSAKGEPEEVTKQAGIFERDELQSATIFMNNSNQIQYYSYTRSSEVICNTKEAVFPVRGESGDIKFVNSQWLVLSNGQNKLEIIENGTWETKFFYQHKHPITSVAVYQSSLLVGDERGKITQLVDFLIEGKSRLTQKLQWHVHAVKSLFVEGSYLYSSGEEGVVVVWHLRENKKDFLPRIGSEIVKLILDGATLYCMLSDNTIKSIDFSNDKAVLQYKVIVSPLMHHIDASSLQLAKSNLVRVSPLADRLWMRSQPGRIQQVDLHSGINREFNIVSRNIISRLDEAYPAPHQLTDVCFSPDNSQMVVAVEGVHCRGLRFYAYDRNDFQLVSKVENCHSGSKSIKLLWIGEGKFASYTDDKSVKVWKQAVRRKQSIMQIDEHFWCCDYEFNFRGQIPVHISFNNHRLVITYPHQLVFFNNVTKTIEHVYQVDTNKSEIVAVYQLPNNLLIVYKKSIEVAKEHKGSLVSGNTLLTLPEHLQITSQSIVFNTSNHKFALLIGNHIYIQEDTTVTHLELGKSQNIGDIFWFQNRLIAIDSTRLFHDLTHNQPLLNLQGSDRTFQIEENTAEEVTNLDYSELSRRYMGRQWAKERAGVERLSESMGIAPSVTSCFQLLAHQIFI